ncbi:MAG: lipid-A-disaccharide synthase [Gammaproteobacteria bacterium]
MHIGIVAGEHSGDFLGAELITAIQARYPDAVFEGIAGPRMIEAGCRPLFAMDELSVMGYVEVLSRLARLVYVRRSVGRYFLRARPDVFIGIDSPDFNLGLERRLKRAGIPTVHYVSPTVWAWRQYRMKKIRRSVSRMLTLFPFEETFYDAHGIDVRYVGHPLADRIPREVDKLQARQALEIDTEGPIVALLPGSRASEVSRLAGPFVATAEWCWESRRELRFLAAVTDARNRELFSAALHKRNVTLPVTILEGRSHEVMAAADVVLVSSGTATLEALLLKRPMVVAYRLAPLTYFLAKRMVKLPYYSLPNLLAGQTLVPELIQDKVTPDKLGPLVLDWLDSPYKSKDLTGIFKQIHEALRCNGGTTAASAVLDMVGR